MMEYTVSFLKDMFYSVMFLEGTDQYLENNWRKKNLTPYLHDFICEHIKCDCLCLKIMTFTFKLWIQPFGRECVSNYILGT